MSVRRTRYERGIYFRETPAGRRYEIQFTDSDGKIRWRVIEGGLREARAARAGIIAKKAQGVRVAPTKRTVAEMGAECMAAQRHLRPRTIEVYETNLRVHVYPSLGRRKIADVTVDDVAELIRKLEAKGLAPWTIRGVLSAFGRVLNYAARRGMIPANPISLLETGERPRVSRTRVRGLTANEIERLLRAASDNYRAVLATAIFTGCRQSELLGLRWDDVSFDGGRIAVRGQLGRDGQYVALPKTERSEREIPMFSALAALLRKHKERMFARGFARPDDYVFTTSTGAPMSHRNVVGRGLKKALARAGLPEMRFHDLRHVYAAIAIAEGWSEEYLASVMGHSSSAFTRSVYGGLFDRTVRLREAAAGLERSHGEILERVIEAQYAWKEERYGHKVD